MTQERRVRYLLALFLFILVFAPLFANGTSLLVDWIWFREEGFRAIFTTILKSQIELSGLAGTGFLIIAGINLVIAHAVARRSGFHIDGEYIETPALDRFSSLFRGSVWLGVLLVAFFVGQWGTSHWHDYLFARQAVAMVAAPRRCSRRK